MILPTDPSSLGPFNLIKAKGTLRGKDPVQLEGNFSWEDKVSSGAPSSTSRKKSQRKKKLNKKE